MTGEMIQPSTFGARADSGLCPESTSLLAASSSTVIPLWQSLRTGHAFYWDRIYVHSRQLGVTI